eukprot:GFYU01005435.1.p1 GENE.GFYU01005435.1~~GFYU01005435.1.p1  ORF type:complete len:429 (-),score=140.82 GFYU01005435.1:207-1493(-)
MQSRVHSSAYTMAKFLLVALVGLAILSPGHAEESNTDTQTLFAPIPPEAKMTMEELVQNQGFQVEKHEVETADGYYLTVFRIPPKVPGSPVALLQHGLLDSSATWVMNDRHESLAFILSDAGYDVWMGNNRGNTYSLKHKTYSTKTRQFWDFSWDEMAKYDLPAEIDYILEATGKTSLSYVGHSQGTTQAFAGFSADKGLQAKVNAFAALAPVAYVGRTTSLIHLLGELHGDKLIALTGMKKFMTSTDFLKILFPDVCSATPFLCQNFLFAMFGVDFKGLNKTRIPVYVEHAPAGTSVKNILHWGQEVRSKEFEMYDYGCGILSCKNKKVYGQKTPPQYSLNAVDLPVGLFYGGRDDLGDPADVKQMMKELPAASVKVVNYQADYEHLDFTWGQHAKDDIYPGVVKLFADANAGAFDSVADTQEINIQ